MEDRTLTKPKPKEAQMNQDGKAVPNAESPAKAHAFRHLGKNPYTYIRYEYITYQACPGAPIQVGGSCDHCGTGIKDAFFFRSADGKEFKVGNQCVAKAGDIGLKMVIDDDLKHIRRERKAKRDKARIQAAKDLYTENKEWFDLQLHPNGFKDRETGEPLTFSDWYEWMMKASGTAGKLRVAKEIEWRLKERS